METLKAFVAKANKDYLKRNILKIERRKRKESFERETLFQRKVSN